MLTKAEKKAALYAISFNRGKALRLFLFCLASFCVGICVWYWQLDRAYGKKLEYFRQDMLSTMEEQLKNHDSAALSEVHKGVVSCDGIVDFDQLTYLNDRPYLYEKNQKVVKVHGQKRPVALGVYEIRFVSK